MNRRAFTCVFCVSVTATAFAGETLPTPVAQPNPKTAGSPVANILSPELSESVAARGALKLENPSGVFAYYGYNAEPGRPLIPTAPGSRLEARKTEPDKNVYLILKNQQGADAGYDYGTNFLFQGHEAGISGYVTRVNLDADGAHHVTLMGASDAQGAALPAFDGITWYPFSQRLLLTSEGSLGGGVWQATLDVPSRIESLTGIIGQGGFEGIQADAQGRIMIVEDAGGSSGSLYPHAKRPNSFIFRFTPYTTEDLTRGGKLEALQVMSLRGTPIVYDAAMSADQAIASADVKDLHTYHNTFRAGWVLVHDTRVDGAAPFNANAMAKLKGATPFKRPENGQFRPETGFSEFIFDETGDTNLLTEAGTAYGGFGALFRLRMFGKEATLSLVYNGDPVHSSFDNCAFWDADHFVVVEDGGDTLHDQRNALDSAWLFDVSADYSGAAASPIRILAQGRDTSATLDSLFSSVAGYTGTFNNEGDNEITGWHISDGDASVQGLLGAKMPHAFKAGWRMFYTQQHGDNSTFEVTAQQ